MCYINLRLTYLLMSTKPVFEKITEIQRSYVPLCGHTTFVPWTPAPTMTVIDRITICNDVKNTFS